MGLSIQDYLKKINSWLSFIDIMSIFVTFLGLLLFTLFVFDDSSKKTKTVVYNESKGYIALVGGSKSVGIKQDSRPFGSIHGKTYTYAWCGGSGNIKPANKIYFNSFAEAEAKGRTLSKLCRR